MNQFRHAIRRNRLPLLGFSFVFLLFNGFSYLFSSARWYNFTTRDGQFTFDAYPAQGRDVAMMHRCWEHYAAKNHPTDTVIFRTFSKNYLYVWRWMVYARPEYRFPYIDKNQLH